MTQTRRNIKTSRRNRKRTFKKTRQRRIKGGNETPLIAFIKALPNLGVKGQNTQQAGKLNREKKDELDELLKAITSIDDFNQVDTNGRNALHYASLKGYEYVAIKISMRIFGLLKESLLLEESPAKTDTDVEKNVDEKFTTFMKELVNKQDKDGNTPFHLAVRKEEWFFNKERIPDVRDTAIIDYLLLYADINLANNLGNTPLHFASILCPKDSWANKYGKVVSRIKLLLKKPIDDEVTSDEQHDITSWQNRDGVNLSPRNKKGETPLHFACFSGNIEGIQYLIEMGAELFVEAEYRQIPFHYLCRGSRKEQDEPIFKTFIEQVTEREKKERNTSYISEGKSKVMQANANRKDVSGKTPLYYITKENEHNIRLSDIVKLVIKNGGNVTIKDKNGLSPKDMICRMDSWTQNEKKNALKGECDKTEMKKAALTERRKNLAEKIDQRVNLNIEDRWITHKSGIQGPR